jgi:exopolysaccharide production protein ExoQ
MNPLIATFICLCGIVGLFYLDRDKRVPSSPALWLPAIWIGIAGSRAVSQWFGLAPVQGNLQLEGSPIDAAVYGILLFTAILVLTRRKNRTATFLANNWLVLLYFAYCLISVTWSYHPDVSFKRWIKAIGDVAICLVIVTEDQPIAALRRVISRIGFILFPTSVLLIKYYEALGRTYTADGQLMNTGVTTNKNMLGVMVLVVALCTLWHVMYLLRSRREPYRRRHLIAHFVLLALGADLFVLANSSTSTACFILGAGVILASTLRAMRNRPMRVHALCLGIFLLGGLVELFGGQDIVAQILGRQSNLSGRTDIWAALIPAAPNPVVGAGFEGFWISPSVLKFQNTMLKKGWWHPEVLNEAHNGYLEVYLNLGWIGVGLISAILLTAYRRGLKAFRLDWSIGSLTLAYVVSSAVYNITEAGFRMLDLMWIFLLLAIFTATAVTKSSHVGRGTQTRLSQTVRSQMAVRQV